MDLPQAHEGYHERGESYREDAGEKHGIELADHGNIYIFSCHSLGCSSQRHTEIEKLRHERSHNIVKCHAAVYHDPVPLKMVPGHLPHDSRCFPYDIIIHNN